MENRTDPPKLKTRRNRVSPRKKRKSVEKKRLLFTTLIDISGIGIVFLVILFNFLVKYR